MSKSRAEVTFIDGLMSAGLYKRNQGRLTRQLTAAALALVLYLGMWSFSTSMLAEYERPVRVYLPVVLAVVGSWLIYRAVNFPRFADFLISVEAEVDKVTWASWAELRRATVIVLSVMFLIGAAIYVLDLIWLALFGLLEIVQIG